MKARFAALTVVVLLLGLLVSAVGAQDIDPCFGLSAEDCEVISSASANTLVATQSFQQDFTISFSATNIPDSEDITFNAVGSGPVIIDLESDIPLSFGVVLDVDFTGPEGTDAGTIEARLIDGIFYLQDPENPDQWLGVDVTETMQDPDFAQALGMPIPTDPDQIEDMAGQLDMSQLEPFAELLSVPGFITYTREGNTFQFVADAVALINAPEFAGALETAGQMSGDESIAMVGMMAPMLLSEGLFTVTQTVNPDMNIVESLGFNVDTTVDAGMIAGDPEMEPITISLNFQVNLSNINGQFDLVVPDNVQMEEAPTP